MPEHDDRRDRGDERSGAFVARVWRDEQGLRARIRHTAELRDLEETVTIAGPADHVVPDLVDHFENWIERFARDTGPSVPPVDHDDDPMTTR